jgi:hypothetical protein
MFKFDFSAEEDGSSNRLESTQNPSNDGCAMINKLQRRCETSKCTIVNVSAQSLSSTRDCTEDFEPKLGFHRQETVDLLSSNVDPVRYVIPRHTLSDSTTDLIPGVYEGGLKVWECSVDLCRFLASVIEKTRHTGVNLDDSVEANTDLDAITQAVKMSISPGGSTLELGCGHGLPGCLILRENVRNNMQCGNDTARQSSIVVFADFNDFVLQHATIPNAQINVSGLLRSDGSCIDEYSTAQTLLNQAMFVGGDWMGLSAKLTNESCMRSDDRFDLILAAETTYTTESCNDTVFLMAKHLKIDTGVGLIATKRFYFGVGGGSDMLFDAVKMFNSSNTPLFSKQQLAIRTIKNYDTGNANIRDLIEIRLLSSHKK